MKALGTAIVCVVVSFQAMAAAPNTSCPAATILPRLDAAYHACSSGFIDGSCQQFISEFKRVTAPYNCHRSFDKAPVPAVWLAPRGALDDFVRLAWRLASDPQFNEKLYKNVRSEARIFFGSKEFRGVLDGSLAEDYAEKSREVERQLKQASP